MTEEVILKGEEALPIEWLLFIFGVLLLAFLLYTWLDNTPNDEPKL